MTSVRAPALLVVLAVPLTFAACAGSGDLPSPFSAGLGEAGDGGSAASTTATTAGDGADDPESSGGGETVPADSGAGETTSAPSSSSAGESGSESGDTPTDDCAPLWTSAAWANGNPRVLEEEEVDPDDPLLFFSHAGDGTHGEIDGEGTLVLDGDQSRFYLLVPNQDVRLKLEVEVTDPALDNVSLALRCNHDEPGSFGKYGAAYSWADTEVSAKVEYYHNDHGDDQAAALPEALELDTRYALRVELRNAADGSRVVEERAWIRRTDELEWTLVLDIEWTQSNWGEPPTEQDNPEYADYVDGPYMPEARRLWVRVNGRDGEPTVGTRVSNASVCAFASE